MFVFRKHISRRAVLKGVGATVALPVNRRHSVKLYASSGLSVRTGSDFDIFGAAWQYRWGAGL